MTVVLELPVEIEEKFKNAARRQGLSVEQFLIGAGEFAAQQEESLPESGVRPKLISEQIHEDRREDLKREEERFERHFGSGKNQ